MDYKLTIAPPLPSSKRWFIPFSLRIAIIVCGVLVLALTGQPASTKNVIPILFLGPPAGLSILWSAADAACYFIHPSHHGITPGARVGMDLIISLAYISLEIVNGILITGWTDEEYPSNTKDSDRIHAMVEAALAFGGIATIIHVGLFVVACVETHRENTEVKVLRANALALGNMRG
ncbi:membrane-associating domain protein [Metarhizium robertsii]|uniref:Membrane-associating domain protein n=2 Tax=Metarhizium robertsii TaxID=568076 RepID=E9F371_METRA|nr:uncharacterized protein MAA_06720 [Metarhizium robertsii ARSEF 23]EFY97937.1 hypothetical protein MAA_06720 [Metarhizium robertsii ARSEF 23]EXU97533.1 membrane-associating domain protein [Metarhizium robertsii]